MLKCREGTDLYILYGPKEIAVHRALLWSHSPRLKDLSMPEKSQYGVSLCIFGALRLAMSFSNAPLRGL